LCAALFVLFSLAFAPGAFAQPYDVPYVPTPQVVVDEMLRTANVGAEDFVIDLGSGDGRILITAASEFGARGFGVDIDPGRIAESNTNARAAGVTGRVEFINGNLFEMDISRATVVTMYLLPSVNLKLRPRLFEVLKPGTRVVSHDFTMGDWKPDRVVLVQKNIFYWVIPARIEGRWKIDAELSIGERTYDVEIRQKFQEIDGFARGGQRNSALWETKLEGEEFTFVIVDEDVGHRFEGKVRGRTMEGVVRSGVGRSQTEGRFRATRTGNL